MRTTSQAISVLSLLALVAAKTDLGGCTSTVDGSSVVYYVPGTGEICAFLDCGGGRAPPKTTVPGCAAYSGTATYSPSYLTAFGAVATSTSVSGVVVTTTSVADSSVESSITGGSTTVSSRASGSGSGSASATLVSGTLSTSLPVTLLSGTVTSTAIVTTSTASSRGDASEPETTSHTSGTHTAASGSATRSRGSSVSSGNSTPSPTGDADPASTSGNAAMMNSVNGLGVVAAIFAFML